METKKKRTAAEEKGEKSKMECTFVLEIGHFMVYTVLGDFPALVLLLVLVMLTDLSVIRLSKILLEKWFFGHMECFFKVHRTYQNRNSFCRLINSITTTTMYYFFMIAICGEIVRHLSPWCTKNVALNFCALLKVMFCNADT